MATLAKIRMDIPYKLSRVNNGTRILTINAKNTGLCFLQIIIRVGSMDEGTREAEIAHFLEHINGSFTSSKYPSAKKVQERIEQFGGEFNASVEDYETEFHISGSMDFIAEFWELLSESFIDFVPDISMLEKERNSMREELNDELNEQWIKLDEAVMKSLWGNHRAARTVKDRLKILNSLTIRDILRFRKKFYIPKLTTIVISADTPLQKSQDMAKRLALALPNRTQSIPRPQPKLKPRKVQTKEVIFVPNKLSGSYNLYIIFRTRINTFSKLNNAALVLTDFLTEGMSSVLMSELRTDAGLVYGISCSVSADNVDPNLSYFRISTTVKGENLMKVVKRILDILKRIDQKLISNRDLSRLSNQLLTSVLDSASTRDPEHYAEQYSSEVPWGKGVRTFRKSAKDLKKCISKRVLNETANKIFRDSKMIIAYSGKKAYPEISKLRL